MIFLKKNYKKIPRNKKTRKSSIFFNRFIVHRIKAPFSFFYIGKLYDLILLVMFLSYCQQSASMLSLELWVETKNIGCIDNNNNKQQQ